MVTASVHDGQNTQKVFRQTKNGAYSPRGALADYSRWKLFAPIGYNFHQYNLGEVLTSILKRASMGRFFTFSTVCSH